MDNVFEKIKKEVRDKLQGVDSCHELEHTERVYNLAMSIGREEKADLEILGLAAIMHDIARKEQDESGGKIDHAERGAELAAGILEKYNFSKEKIEAIIHCVRTHRFRKNNTPRTLEAKILYDADKLDSIGAIGIGRAFSFSGHIGSKVHDKNVDVEKTKELSPDDSAYREYLIKLKHIKDRILTSGGKKIAKDRHFFMEQFFDRLNKEVDGKL